MSVGKHKMESVFLLPHEFVAQWPQPGAGVEDDRFTCVSLKTDTGRVTTVPIELRSGHGY